MFVRHGFRLLALAALVAACGDDYDGGGRRTSLPGQARDGGINGSVAGQAGMGAEDSDAGPDDGGLVDGAY
jgi:hypothetical protein